MKPGNYVRENVCICISSGSASVKTLQGFTSEVFLTFIRVAVCQRKCQGKTKFSPGQGILKKCQGIWPFDPCQGIVREFCHIMSGNCQGILL